MGFVKRTVVVVLMLLFVVQGLAGQERAIAHAPIGVMGDHYHGKGEWMVSLRHMRMSMAGNRDGTSDLTDGAIINLTNPYQMGTMSTKLSVVPQQMTMGMTMAGAMYAPSDALTLMAMGMFTSKIMDLNTYRGAMPMGGMGGMTGMARTQLGSFTSSTSDLSDMSLSGLIRLYEGDVSRVHAQLGLQQSMGANDSTGSVLTPMNSRTMMILPYGMQIGDGATSVLSGITYVAELGRRVYGTQVRARNAFATDDWNFGDNRSLTGWVQQELNDATSVSFRTTYYKQDAISGQNTAIVAPVQTANPANYGGTMTEVSVGLNRLVYLFPGEHSDRIGIELSYPVSQDLNGPQMKSGVTLQIGYQKSLN